VWGCDSHNDGRQTSLPTARGWPQPHHPLHDCPVVPSEGAISCPWPLPRHAPWIALPPQRPPEKPSHPRGHEMDGLAALGRVSSMNGLALRLMLGLAWLILAPIASAESRVWIGVTIYDDASARIRDGTVVLVVHEGSPAYATGIRPGDVLVEVDGLRIANSNHFICLIAAHLPGEIIKLSTIRAGENRIATVTLAERPPNFYVTPHDCARSVAQSARARSFGEGSHGHPPRTWPMKRSET
jgi:hypothetical protein